MSYITFNAGRMIGRPIAKMVLMAEQIATSIPRPLKDDPNTQVRTKLIKAVVGGAFAVYSAKSGKSMTAGLVDRRLTRTGRTIAVVNVTLNAIVVLVSTHELVVRQLNKFDATH